MLSDFREVSLKHGAAQIQATVQTATRNRVIALPERNCKEQGRLDCLGLAGVRAGIPHLGDLAEPGVLSRDRQFIQRVSSQVGMHEEGSIGLANWRTHNELRWIFLQLSTLLLIPNTRTTVNTAETAGNIKIFLV